MLKTPSPPPAHAPVLARRLMTTSPDHAGIVLGHDLAYVAVARGWVKQSAHTTASRGLEIALVTSELVTNALLYSRSGLAGGETVVELLHRGSDITLRVNDQGPLDAEHPAVGLPEVDDPGGRGLLLVDHLASAWGWARCSKTGATVTTASFDAST